MKKDNRGRPSSVVEKKLKYTQIFHNEDGTISTWKWDKTINKNGPLSVEIEYPNYKDIDKLLNEKGRIEDKYIALPGQRKPRILKVDKQRLMEIEKELEVKYNKL